MEDNKKKLNEDNKLAKPDSPEFRAYYAQQRRKKRKNRNNEV